MVRENKPQYCHNFTKRPLFTTCAAHFLLESVTSSFVSTQCLSFLPVQSSAYFYQSIFLSACTHNPLTFCIILNTSFQYQCHSLTYCTKTDWLYFCKDTKERITSVIVFLYYVLLQLFNLVCVCLDLLFSGPWFKVSKYT